MENDGPKTYTAVLDTSGEWEPGWGWYVVDQAQEDVYIAFCGPDYDPLYGDRAQREAERIARLLTANEQ